MKRPSENASLLLQTITAYVLLSLLYRISLIDAVWHTYSIVVPLHLANLLLGLTDDALTGLALGVCLFIIPDSLISTKKIIFFLLLSTCAVFYVASRQVYYLLSLPLTTQLLSSAKENGITLFYCLPFLKASDWLLLFAPPTLFVFFRLTKKSCLHGLLYYFIFPISVSALSYGLLAFAWYNEPLQQASLNSLYQNPLKHLVLDYYQHRNKYYERRRDQASALQKKSFAFIDQNFIVSTPPSQPLAAALPLEEKSKWNIVVVVMESVGNKYAFATPYSSAIAMPFLYQLAQKSLWLKNNYTSGNNSALGSFGLFSGIYPPPVPDHFILQPHINIPNMATWLGKEYDSFFVTPSDTHLYFPLGFFKNQQGLKYFYDASSLPGKNKTLLYNMFLSDRFGLNFFLSRLTQAKPPFFAIYWPTATHFPYHDYHFDHSFLPPKNPLNCYLNNLRFLDNELQTIYTLLEKKHWLNHTIFIVVGDHGEGFGQHLGSYIHSTRLFEEQIAVPAILYQPRLFKPQQITQPTTSADILPTLLDALHMAHSPHSFQGESLLKRSVRKYVFIYGEEDSLAAIDRDQFKTYLSWSEDRCARYNLVLDPEEHHPLPCLPEAESALIQFRHYQPALLKTYNKEHA